MDGHGVDFSDVAITRARELAAREHLAIEFVCATSSTTSRSQTGFDLVLVLYLQVPAIERRVVLERAAAALREDGTFLLVGHDLTNATDGAEASDPDLLYTLDDIVAELGALEVEGPSACCATSQMRTRRSTRWFVPVA